MGQIGEIFAKAGLQIDNASFAQYGAELKTAESGISKFGDSTQTILAGAFTLPAATMAGLIGYGTQLASSFEDASATLTTVYGNADVAKQKFQWLADFAATTPFEFPELLDASVKLKAYGIDAQQYMGVLGDTASAMGKSLDDTVEAVADAETGEFERLKEFGIKAVQITKSNCQQYGATVQQVGQTALTYTDKYGKQQAAIVDRNNRQQILSTVTAIWNSKYEGAMQTRSKTLSGMLSNLKDNLTLGLADIVGFNMKTMQVDTLSLLGVFKLLTGGAVTLTGALTHLSEPMQTLIVVLGLGVSAFGLVATAAIAYNAILPVLTANNVLFGASISAAIWPVTAIVGALALVAAGLVYLDEKTGIVTASLQFLDDVFTIDFGVLKEIVSGSISYIEGLFDSLVDDLKSLASDLGLDGIASDISGAFQTASNSIGGFADYVHGIADTFRGDTDDMGNSAGDAANAIGDADNSAENAHDSWLDSAKDLATGSQDAYKDVQGAAQQTQSAYDKAVEEMNQKLQTNKSAQIKLSVGVDTEDLQRGVQLVDGSLVILNNEGQLVHHTLQGTDEVLSQMGTHHFETTRGGLDVLVSNGSNMQKTMSQADNITSKTKDDVVVLDTSISKLNSNQLVGLNGQIVTTKNDTAAATQSASQMKSEYSSVNGQSLGGISGQVQGVGNATTTATGKVGTWQQYLQHVNVSPMSTLQGNLSRTGSTIDTDKSKTGTWNTTLGQTNSSPFGSLFGNLSTSGSRIDTDKTKTGNWNTTLGRTNSSPFGSLFGNLSTSGSRIDTNKTKTGVWNSTLGKTNSSPFSTLFSHLGTAKTNIDTVKSKTDTANGSMHTLGSFTFSTTLSSLSSIGSSIEDSIIDKAKDAYNWLKKLGGASSGGSSTGSSSSTTNNHTTNNVIHIHSTESSSSGVVSAIRRATGL